MAVIDQLIVQFSADFKELSRELNKAQGETSRAMKGMENALKPIGTAFRVLGAVAAAAGLSLSVDFAKRTLDAAGGLGEMAEQLGISTDGLQAFQFAAAQAGVRQEQLNVGFSTLSRTIGQAAAGNDAAIGKFNALGIGILDAQGKVRSTEVVIADLADAMAKMQSPAERAAAAQALMGESGQKLLPLLTKGAAGIREFTAAARNAGAVLDGQLIAQADEASDKIAAMETASAKLAQTLAAKLAPSISSIADSMRQAFGGATLDERISELERQIASPQMVPFANPAWKKALEDRLALLRRQKELQAAIDGAPLPGTAAGATSNPEGDAERKKRDDEIKKNMEDNVKGWQNLYEAQARMAEKTAEDQLRWNGIVTDAYIQSGIAITEAQKAHQEELTKQMNAVVEGTRNLAEANAKIAEEKSREAADAARELGLTFTSAFEDAVVAGKKLSEVLQGLAQDIIRIMVRKTVTEPLANFGTSLLGNLFNFGKAGGGTISGPTLVGERGPEVFMPGGSGAIVPMSRMSGGAGVTYNIDARGADPSVLPRLEALGERWKREAVSMAVNTVKVRNAREPSFLAR